jgi:hypothetical protein
MNNFNSWFDTFIEEKGVNLGAMFRVEDGNLMEIGMVVDAIKKAPASEQAGIKSKLVELDSKGATTFHYLKSLA